MSNQFRFSRRRVAAARACDLGWTLLRFPRGDKEGDKVVVTISLYVVLHSTCPRLDSCLDLPVCRWMGKNADAVQFVGPISRFVAL